MVVKEVLQSLLKVVDILKGVGRFRANVAHKRQSRPYAGLHFKVKLLETFQGVPSRGSGYLDGHVVSLAVEAPLEGYSLVAHRLATCRCHYNIT